MMDDELNKKVRTALLWLSSTTAIWQVLTWALTVATVRVLSPTEYGTFALAMTVFPYLQLVADLNINTWLVQESALNELDKQRAFVLAVMVGLIVAAATLAVAPAIATFYGQDELVSIVRAIAVAFILQGIYTVPYGMLRRELNFRSIAIMDLTLNVSRAVLTLGLALSDFGYWALVAGLLFREIGVTIWVLLAAGLPRPRFFDMNFCSRALGFGFAATAAAMLYLVYSAADDVIIGKLLGPEVLGIYFMAFFLIDMPTSKLNGIVKPVLISYFSKFKEHPDAVKRKFLKVVRAYVGVTTPIFAGLALVASEFVPVVMGEQWLQVVWPIIALCVFAIIRATTDNIRPLLLALGHPRREVLVNVGAVIVLPALFLVGCLNFGIDGILFVQVVVFPFVVPAMLLASLRRLVGITFSAYVSNLMAPIVSSLTMIVFVLATGSFFQGVVDTWALLVIKVIAGALAYVVSILVFFRKDANELAGFLRSPGTIAG
jgi:O-antigen/teichoic acid export membrane protein